MGNFCAGKRRHTNGKQVSEPEDFAPDGAPTMGSKKVGFLPDLKFVSLLKSAAVKTKQAEAY